jgi:dolichol-phosphate mannosyltransferase
MNTGQLNDASLSHRTVHGIAVVIPCYRVRHKILDVIAGIGAEVNWIFAVDDACPDQSGALIESQCTDARVHVLRHEKNAGVGGATCTGFAAALDTDADIIIKLDGDGQMDPALIPNLVAAIALGQADLCKGNRFHRLGDTRGMPALRLFGNAGLSLLSKIATGYWQIFDPTNGFLAIHRSVLAELDLKKLHPRYFFESDLLAQLALIRARVRDVPMRASYADEISSMRPLHMIGPFLYGHARNFLRRLTYQYFVRGFSLASIQLALGAPLLVFGMVFGARAWHQSIMTGQAATAGTVMLSALPIILGIEFLLSWLNFDVHAEPRDALWPMLSRFNKPVRRNGRYAPDLGSRLR